MRLSLPWLACVSLAAMLSGCSKDDAATARDRGDAAHGGDASAAGDRIYATMMGADEVVAIDGASRTIGAHIPVGSSPAILLGTPDRSKLYTANWGDNTISAIDVASTKVRTIALDGRPWVEAMSPDGASVYAGLGSNEIAVIDTESDTITRSLPFDTLPASITVSPDSKTLYVARLGDNTLEAVSAATGELVHPAITVGSAPAWITISPDGSTVYTLNFLTGDVTVVDTDAWSVSTTVALGSDSAGIVGNVSPDGSVLCVTDYGTRDVAAVDTKTNRPAWKLSTEGRPVGIGFSPDGARGYAGDYGPDSLAYTPADLIDALAKMTVLRPTGMGRIAVFDPKSGEMLDSIPVGPGPSSIVVTAP
jgi:YVTN family beta-propeller protein